jgi:sorbitol/mannitol transport system permease protein
MLYSFFKELPKEILEAARMDGAGPFEQMLLLIMPLSAPGIASLHCCRSSCAGTRPFGA